MTYWPSFLKRKTFKGNKIKPTVLLVLDGYGLAPASSGNAISLAKTPNYQSYLKKYPSGELIASGESVGLPANEKGNTEVGHLMLGAGRIIYQDLKRINMAIDDGSFYENSTLLAAVSHLKRYNSTFHIMGLVGTGKVHSSIEHLYALLKFCMKSDIRNVYLHLFTDGRDTPPQEALEQITKLEEFLRANKVAEIATISGRYYAMDRDRRWDRTQKAYQAIVAGEGQKAASATEAIQKAYQNRLSDEFIEPTVILNGNLPKATVGNNDVVIFFNYRVDRVRQLTMSFVVSDFEKLKSFEFGYAPGTELEEGRATFNQTFIRGKWPQNLFFVTMTEYHKKLPVGGIIFGPLVVDNTLAHVISNANMCQMHMAESEKERFVTYYFDGMHEEPPKGEEVDIIASPKVPTYDKKPEMSVFKLVDAFRKQMKKDKYHFFIINFANPDMVAHSGNLKATISAIEYTDRAMGEIVEMVLSANGTVIVTADHGNAEELMTFPGTAFFFTTSEGLVNTDHSNNPVPVIIVNQAMGGRPAKMAPGGLYDIAPTVLSLMNIPLPAKMTGRNLLGVK